MEPIGIPGSNIKILCVEYDIEERTAIFGVIIDDKLTDFQKFSDIKQGTFLNFVSDYVTFVDRTEPESLILAMGRRSGGFFIQGKDSDVLGYSTCDIDNLIPGRMLLLDDEIKIHKGERVQLAN